MPTQTHKQAIYPYDEWRIIEQTFDVESNYQDETIFATGNGYIGIRGNFEEGYSGPVGTSLQGTYLNGFYDSEPIRYGEVSYGYAKSSQTMLNVTDSKPIYLLVDGEQFSLFSGTIRAYERILNMKDGILSRKVVWETATGKQIQIHIQRLVCFHRKHLAAISYEVTPLNFSGEVTLSSGLNGQVQNQVTLGDSRVGSAFQGQVLKTEEIIHEQTYASVRQRTSGTKFALVCAMDNDLQTANPYTVVNDTKDQAVSVRFTVRASEGTPIRLTKYIAYYTSKDYPETELLERARAEVTGGKTVGFADLAAAQQAFLCDYWAQTDVEIDGDVALQQSLRFNAFHLLQSVGRDGRTNIAAKGVTGEGYEGHYFWDTETYIFPFFLYTHPDISRKLLEYRYNTLDQARARASELSHRGALYAWRTIDGEETSPYYPAGTAAYHINADIIYALKKYMSATDDTDFFLTQGAEMLFETARLWVDLGDYIPNKGNRFCLNEVTGPDEYTALVNNNVYTNLMAKDHLEYAAQMAHWMRAQHPQAYSTLVQKIDLTATEIAEWTKAANSMEIPFNAAYGIYPQDDTFLDKAVWDFEHTPPEHYPLLLHYHPLEIYRYQVLKQADLVLALFLQGNRFTTAEKKRNYDYYEAITTHDSSLSPCIYNIIGAEIGYVQKAYDYFMRTARMDLDDYNGNVKDGIHSASMAGAWLSIVNGFAGLRDYDGRLRFNPVIPDQWNHYRFKITFQDRLLEVTITKENAVYQLLRGEPLTINHQHRALELSLAGPVIIATEPQLEAVIFDLDGVITDTAEYHYQAWKQLADEIEVPFDRTINDRLKGIGRMESLEIILERSALTYSQAEKSDMAAKKNVYYKQLIQGITPNDLLPGIPELLADLKSSDIKIGLASASKNAFAVIDKLGVRAYFDTIVDAAKLQKGKPDPEIFFTAADQLQVAYQNCIGIEDAESGVRAIQDAGMRAVGVGTPAAMNASDWPVSNTREITLEGLRTMMRSHHGA